MVEVFKTNVREKEFADKIIQQLKEHFPDYTINFDLEDCDKILRIESNEMEIHLLIHELKQLNIKFEVLS